MRATADQVRVLIVDDDELFAESLASMLTDEEEIEVVGWVSNALDAISFVASDHPDVVLMDVAMPGMNGVEAAKIIARDDPGARVVLLSGSIFGEQLEQITGETGAVAYVTKARVAIDLVPMLLAAKANRAADPGQLARLYAEDAELYDIAFDWDLGPEVDWLLERLGPDCHSVLEPGCGSGRMLEALAGHGLDVAGIDVSPEMIAIARRRAPEATIVLADMVDFDLGRIFDGAVCPIGTLTHLVVDELPRHLEAMARHLRAGAGYLVQLGILDPNDPPHTSRWDSERGQTRLRIEWGLDEVDSGRMHQRQHSKIEVLSGPRAGEVVEEEHMMTAWTWEAWDAAIAASPFEQAAVYDGNQKERPRVQRGTFSGLLWHELVAV